MLLFFISAPFCYGVTMNYTEILRNYSASADKGCNPKLCLYAVRFHDLFAKHRNSMKNIASGKVLVEALNPQLWP